MTQPSATTFMRNQHGLITFDQALLVGLTPDQVRARVRRGEWVGVARRLYRSAIVPVTFEQRVLYGCLLAGSDAMASHMTAAVLHRLEGARAGTVPLEPGLIVATRYERGARWRPRRLSRGRAMMELLAHTLPARVRPADSLAAIERVTGPAVALKGPRGEARDLARALLTEDLFSRI